MIIPYWTTKQGRTFAADGKKLAVSSGQLAVKKGGFVGWGWKGEHFINLAGLTLD